MIRKNFSLETKTKWLNISLFSNRLYLLCHTLPDKHCTCLSDGMTVYKQSVTCMKVKNKINNYFVKDFILSVFILKQNVPSTEKRWYPHSKLSCLLLKFKTLTGHMH